MDALAASFDKQFAASQRASETYLEGISDLRFTDTNRVPFPFQKLVREKLNVASLALSSEGPSIVDLDGNRAIDISGSYGVNVCGYDAYKRWTKEGWEKTKDLGPVLGPLHPIVGENLAMMAAMDEVSFHMSGTEGDVRVPGGPTCACKLVVGRRIPRWWTASAGPGNERAVRRRF